MKTCSTCGDLKPLERYSLDSRHKDGRQSRCRDCVKDYQRRYRENREHYLSVRRAEYERRKLLDKPRREKAARVKAETRLRENNERLKPEPPAPWGVELTGPCDLVTERLRPTGYAAAPGTGGHGQLAHVVALEKALGRPLRPGYQANHHCDQKNCVNPEHLYEGTQRQNIHDQLRRGRHPMRSRTHCKNGHPYSGENLYVTPAGKRQCKTCKASNSRRYYAK